MTENSNGYQTHYIRLVLYVNTTAADQQVTPARPGKGLLSGVRLNGVLRLGPFGVDLVE